MNEGERNSASNGSFKCGFDVDSGGVVDTLKDTASATGAILNE